MKTLPPPLVKWIWTLWQRVELNARADEVQRVWTGWQPALSESHQSMREWTLERNSKKIELIDLSSAIKSGPVRRFKRNPTTRYTYFIRNPKTWTLDGDKWDNYFSKRTTSEIRRCCGSPTESVPQQLRRRWGAELTQVSSREGWFKWTTKEYLVCLIAGIV